MVEHSTEPLSAAHISLANGAALWSHDRFVAERLMRSFEVIVCNVSGDERACFVRLVDDAGNLYASCLQ